jgi:hypothetical protein
MLETSKHEAGIFFFFGERGCEFHDLKMSSLFHYNIKEKSGDSR